jgi:hypothetical protein
MKAMLSVLSIGAVSAAINIMGIDLPSIEKLEESRLPGMPYLHKDTKVLLGKIYWY